MWHSGILWDDSNTLYQFKTDRLTTAGYNKGLHYFLEHLLSWPVYLTLHSEAADINCSATASEVTTYDDLSVHIIIIITI